MGNSVAGIKAMSEREFGVDPEFRIEEVELLVDIITEPSLGRRSIGRPAHPQSHVSVLQVGKGTQSFGQLVGSLGVEVGVGLLSVVVVVNVIGYEVVYGFLHPSDVTDVVAVVFVPAAAECSREIPGVIVVQGSSKTVEIVLQPLLPHQRTLRLCASLVESVFGQLAFFLILFVKSLPVGVM